MRSKLLLVQLNDIVRLHYGSALRAADRDESGPHVVFGSNGPVGSHSAKLVEYPTLIVGRKGSVGSVYYAPEGGWPIDTTYYTEIIEPQNLDLRYLYYVLRNTRLDRHTIVTSIPGLNRDSLYRTKIPLPPLPEQKRIADILDKADGIRRKRLAATKTASHLIQSGFYQLFGDTLLNPQGFKMGPLYELVGAIVDCPHSTPKYSEKETEYYCARSSDIQEGVVDLSATRFVSEATYHERIARHTPKSGEVIYTREGGRLGNAAQIPPDKKLCLGQRMMLFSAEPGVSTNEFIWALLNSRGIRHQVTSLVAGAAAPRINISDIRKFIVPLASYGLQANFSSFVRRIRDHTAHVDRSIRLSNSLFNSLVQRAFNGEL